MNTNLAYVCRDELFHHAFFMENILFIQLNHNNMLYQYF